MNLSEIARLQQMLQEQDSVIQMQSSQIQKLTDKNAKLNQYEKESKEIVYQLVTTMITS